MARKDFPSQMLLSLLLFLTFASAIKRSTSQLSKKAKCWIRPGIWPFYNVVLLAFMQGIYVII